ncbi:hypothetical protein [Actinomycetospora sp. CA-053990]|uniref:hypothetical protein n=1 Tax=Actinomycetospora sp. CA-053990 TaxID=3239891 RepID=UPI003D8E843E
MSKDPESEEELSDYVWVSANVKGVRIRIDKIDGSVFAIGKSAACHGMVETSVSDTEDESDPEFEHIDREADDKSEE